MTTYASAVDLSSFSTDAKFRAWVAGVHNGMSAAGFVQTSDTGQINPSTVNKPTAINTSGGYEIWRFADSLQATAPIFMRFYYNSNAVASGNGVTLVITIGTGSDGAGNITGLQLTITPGAYTASTALTNTASPILACHTAGYGMIMPGALMQSTNNAGFYAIMRTCNTSGTLTGEGVTVYYQHQANSFSTAVKSISFTTGTIFSTATLPRAGVPQGANSMTSGNAVPMAKNYAYLGYMAPCYGALSYYGLDVAANSTFSTTVWGATSHTYLAMGTGYINFVDSLATSGITAAFLWE